MKKNCFIIIFFFSCVKFFSQELILDEGLYIEKPDYSNPAKDKYSKDNISYKSHTVFVFDYYYMDNSGVKKKFLLENNWTEGNPLNLTSIKDHSDSVITKIKLAVDETYDEIFREDSSLTQTVFSYDFISGSGRRQNPFTAGDEIDGLIDNSKNVCLFMPGRYTFKILNLCPFPYYWTDESVKRWVTQREVGGPLYNDPRWIDWKDKLVIDYEYKRGGDEELDTPLGKIKCKVINATASSEFGNSLMKTKLKSYYHPDHGFVRLEFDNINGSKLVMQLIEQKKLRARITSTAKTIAEYYQACCTEYFNENLILKEDLTFQYSYSYGDFKVEQTGRYKKNKDTLNLYDFEANALETKELSGEEIVNKDRSDSIEIVFQYPKIDEILAPRFFINGKCPRKFSMLSYRSYLVPKQIIKTISVRGGEYKVKNEAANKFIIYYDPPDAFSFAEEKIKAISKCILKNDVLMRIDCDGSLDPGFKLSRK